jgi:hypothetical protein
VARSAHHVYLIPIVFVANVLGHVRIRFVVHRQRQDQRLSQGLGIVESDLILDVSEIDPPESLGHPQVFGMRVACSIEPTPVVKTGRLVLCLLKNL